MQDVALERAEEEGKMSKKTLKRLNSAMRKRVADRRKGNFQTTNDWYFKRRISRQALDDAQFTGGLLAMMAINKSAGK